jgi:predicted peptidase
VKQKNIKSVTAITEVFGDGQKITAVAIEYDNNINNSKLAKSTFSVEGRTITRVYANSAVAMASYGIDGRYVIIELSIKDKEAPTITETTKDTKMSRKEVKVSITQLGDVIITDGKKYPPDSRAMVNDKVKNLVVDDFLKLEFKELRTGEKLKYNLFIPKGYDRNKSYPLVLFIHDKGVCGDDPELTLIQGVGGVIWATPSEQAKHECFVLAPQYVSAPKAEEDFETTIDLLNCIVNQYSIDTNRLYTTGQSMGCMTSIAMNIKYPDLFTASLLVAGQWDPTAMSVLTKNNMWVVVSEGDPRAFSGMNTSMAALEAKGTRISRAKWNGRASAEEFSSDVMKMIAEGNNIKYAVLKLGTVIPEDQEQDPGKNHMYTWRIAYTIEGLRDWLFTQVKRPSRAG